MKRYFEVVIERTVVQRASVRVSAHDEVHACALVNDRLDGRDGAKRDRTLERLTWEDGEVEQDEYAADATPYAITERKKDFPINLNPSDDEKQDVRDRLLNTKKRRPRRG